MSSLNINQHSLALAAGLGRLQSLTESVSGRVSSGSRIDKPSIDSAGVGKAAKLDATQSSLSGVQVNIQNGMSRMQSTSSQIDIISRLVTRMGEISALSDNQVQNASDRALYGREFAQIQAQLRQTVGGTTAEIGGTADVSNPAATFNGSQLFSAGPTPEKLTIGTQVAEQLDFPVINFRAGAIGAILHQDAAGAFTFTLGGSGSNATLTSALQEASVAQSNVGAVQSRLDFAANIAITATTNNEAALSSIRDTDLAKEMTSLSRLQILTQGRTAMLGQARDASAKLITLLQ